MKPILVEEKVRQTIHKNTTTSYGLTLVIGLPFPNEICNRIQYIQEQLESLASGHFTWYSADHLHATLVAPLRGRYRDLPPLQREELPADLKGFTHDLADFFTQCQSYSLELTGVHVTAEGFVMIGENNLVQQLASTLLKYPKLDQPKHLKGLHVAIGFFNTPQPFVTDEERVRFEIALAQLLDTPIGRITIQQVWLVHYANRTLNHIIGKVPFFLGQSHAIAVKRLLQELRIGTV